MTGRTNEPAVAAIVDCIGRAAGLDVSVLLGTESAREVSRARAVAVILLRSHTGLSGSDIARILGRTRQWASWFLRVAEGTVTSDVEARALRVRVLHRLSARRRSRAYRARKATGQAHQLLAGLRAARTEAGLTKAQLSRQSGIARPTLSSKRCAGRPRPRQPRRSRLPWASNLRSSSSSLALNGPPCAT